MPPSTHAAGSLNQRTHQALHALLDERAANSPTALGYRFLTDGESAEELLTYGEMAARARAMAALLVRWGATGQPVLLIHSPGLDFIIGLFACWHAGAIAVPAYPPRGSRHRLRLQSVIQDSGAKLALADPGTPEVSGIRMIFPDEAVAGDDPPLLPAIDPALPCLLQYTSGSTAAPKGVMLHHRNFRSHYASLGMFSEFGWKSLLSWLPPYHDMGLVLKVLFAFEAGSPLTFFSPDHFVQKPARWLRAISRYQAEVSGGPNFALEACVRSIRDEEIAGIDLSCWKALPCGAERIRKQTLDQFAERFAPYGFDRDAFLPGYGLAETTLIVTASRRGSSHISHHPTAGALVSNGPPLPGVRLRIVDPVSGNPLESKQTGEILISGAVVSSGYWKRSLETSQSFSEEDELRTGDLGYLENGELYVTGRIKDLIIVDGVNHYPDDIESAALAASDEVVAGAAFAAEMDGVECVALALETGTIPEAGRALICAKVREKIAELLEIQVGRIVLVRKGLLPRTTSGKIQRAATRTALEEGILRVLHDEPTPQARGLTLDVLLAAVSEITGRPAASSDDVIALGMGSLDATRLAALLRSRAGIDVSVGELFAAESFLSLAAGLAHRGASLASRPGTVRMAVDNTASPTVLTHAQERMWFLHQFDPESAAYHVFGALELTGPICRERLQSSFSSVVLRHGILRSRHGFEDGRPKVWIEPSAHPQLEFHEASGEENLRTLLADFARRPFHLATNIPIRALLVRLLDGRHFLAVCAHHIAADGWSLRLLAKELADHYAGHALGDAQSLSAYQDYAAAHRAWIDGGAVDAQIDYWKNRLAGHPGILHLPTDFPRPHKPSSDGGYVVRILPPELCISISDLAKAHRATPFMVQLAAFMILLRQHGAEADAVIAIPVANRNHAEAADLVGTLVNTLPFRIQLQEDDTFASLLERVRSASFEMQDHQDAPFEKIIEAVRPDRSSDHSPLVQVMFDHQEIPIAEKWPDGVTCQPYIAHRGASQFDLSLLLTVYGDQQQLAIEFRTDLFRESTIHAMLDRHLATLSRISAEPALPVSQALTLAPRDCQWLGEKSEGPRRPHFLNQTAPALIATRCGNHPQRIAIRDEGGAINYQNLADRSDQLASNLVAHGIRPGDRVAVLLDRDRDLPVTLLAIWKAGAAYVPLDRSNPMERLKLILEDQAPLRILVSPGQRDWVPAETGFILLDDPLWRSDHRLELPGIAAEDPAYIIYTSGSTGIPKGVVVSHGALANFLQSMAETPGFTEADHLLAVTTVSFDISLLELFLPLVSGGSVEIVPTTTARDGHALLEKLHSSGATVMQATPATWRMLVDAGWRGTPDLKILCGGESLDLELAKVLVHKGCQLWNLYGPTETTVWSTCWRVPAAPEAIRIGTPIANTGIHILSSAQIPTPPGVQGTLWISGAGLADGYWKREDLTASRFAGIQDHDGRSITAYNTGDLARWHDDGTLECIGRSDGQVKIRGFRVELGEIEAAVSSHPQVPQAKVALRGSPSRLVAWFTTSVDQPIPSEDSLRAHLVSRLPAYMIPASFGWIAAFPLNSSGKVDVSHLREPETSQRETGPLTATEEILISIWKDLLGHTSVHPEDNWFHIGGHSLLALRLFGRIHEQFGKRLPLSAILDQPTPQRLARLIDESGNVS
ncbi:MAG: amino acid adenylation domain-containing protein [Akkermansiaceae bacterium]|nr:amino acid adenylation domain-containing protein [Akkermansiaceae bacterium]